MKKNLGWVLSPVLLPCLFAWTLPAAEPAGVAVTASKEHIEFSIGKDLVARYYIAPSVAKPYLWPLNAPGGVPVTRAWPLEKGQAGESTDHVHQKSAWFGHGNVIPEGIELKDKVKGIEGVDFWSEAKGHGNIVCTQTGEPKLDKNHGQITTHNEWRTADGIKIIDETRTIHLYDLGGARLFVFDIDLHASVAPITFGDTKEGSFAVRVSDEIRQLKGNGKLVNAEGKTGEPGCWGQVSKWCDYSGTIAEKPVGIAIFDDPANPAPACWHSRGYGLHAANPFGREKSGFPAMQGKKDLVKLAKGDHFKLRYGLLVHTGDVKDGKVAEYYQKFTSR